MRRLGLALLALAALAGPAGAERRLMEAQEAADYLAVGRLNAAGTRFCTATLIGPTEVLTAGHCLFNPRTGKPTALSELRFVPGLRRDENQGVFRVVAAALPPGYRFARGEPGQEELRRDIALLRLETAPGVRPLALGALDGPPRVVSYNLTRSQAPSIDELCPVLGRIDEVVTLGCGAASGVSGAPILSESGRVAAVVSAMGRMPDGGDFAIGVMAGPWIGILRAELDRAQAALPAQGPTEP
jgi:protease YdgD